MNAGDIGPAFNDTVFYSGSAGDNFNRVISTVIGVMTVVAGVWFLFLLISGGIGIMSAGGDKQAVVDAQKRITMGFIGLVVVIAGVFIAQLIGIVFGIDILDPGGTLESL
jgi:hypothetical protein